MNSKLRPEGTSGNGSPDLFGSESVDAKPSSSRRSSDNPDTSTFGFKANDASSSSLPVEPVPRRKSSTYLYTPTSQMSMTYAMYGPSRGKVLIFNHVMFNDEDFERRDGTEKDVKRLYDTLPRLGFRREDITVFEDHSVAEIRRAAIELQVDKDLEEADCLVVIILTHGEDGDYLMAKDGRYHLYEFIENFTPSSLKSMAGKPKLFIVQACRGTKKDCGVKLRTKSLHADCVPSDAEDTKMAKFTYPEFADLLIVMSSHYGHTSFRNETGSWLIQELCNVIESCDLEYESIYDILTKTNNRVSWRISNSTKKDSHKKKQASSFYSTLTKLLYFVPK